MIRAGKGAAAPPRTISCLATLATWSRWTASRRSRKLQRRRATLLSRRARWSLRNRKPILSDG